MRVLVACEFSGIVREAFAARGHDAWSCDLLTSEIGGDSAKHFQMDVLKILGYHWDLMIAHPPCTFLTTSANKWHLPEFKDKYPDREESRNNAVDFFMSLWNAPINKICIENPKGIMTSRFRRANQYIQPHWFGHNTTKMTGLWLKNLPRLNATDIREPEYIIAASGRRHSPFHYNTAALPLTERAKARSRTYLGIAQAMADQWG